MSKHKVEMKAKKSRKRSQSLVAGALQGIGSTIRDQDMYGQPIEFNYNGSSSFNTIPGGLLSMMAILFSCAYVILKLKYMLTHAEWSIVQ